MIAGLIRLVHPFPSILDGLVVAGAALAAGADGLTAARLGLSMTALQASIGALNDVVDVEADRGRKLGKPIAAGVVSVRSGRLVMILAAVAGLALALPSGPASLGLAVVVLGIGYGYDVLAKGTAWSWLPFALGIPLLPVYGWLGVTGHVEPWFAALLPMAALAGGAIAIANARADLERDMEAGTRTVATALGPDRSWAVMVGLWVGAAGVGVASLASRGPSLDVWAVVIGGLAVVIVGLAVGRRGDPWRRQRSWEAQAVGAGIAALGWLIGIA